MYPLTLYPHWGYKASYAVFVEFYEQFRPTKHPPIQEEFDGNTYIIPETELVYREETWLQKREGITRIEYLWISYDPASHREALDHNGVPWCGFREKKAALIELPSLIHFLAEMEFEQPSHSH